MTVYESYTAPNGHEWTLYEMPRLDAPYTALVAEHCGSGERIIEDVDLRAPYASRTEAVRDLLRMVDGWEMTPLPTRSSVPTPPE